MIIQRGQASFLNKRFHGRKTANGEKYHEDKLTVAHKSLDFGTVLRVTRLSNGRSTLVRVNDRGPFVDGRHVDLSLAAARELNMLRGGVTRVQYEVITDAAGVPLQRDQAFYLLLQQAESAHEAARRLSAAAAALPAKNRKYLPTPGVFKTERDPNLPQYFIGIGPFTDFDTAHAAYFQLPAKQRPAIICVRATREAVAMSGTKQ